MATDPTIRAAAQLYKMEDNLAGVLQIHDMRKANFYQDSAD